MENQELTMEKILKAVEGLQNQIALNKAENQKLRNELNQVNIDKDKMYKELNRLRTVNNDLEIGLKEKKDQITHSTDMEEFNEFMDKLGDILKWK